MEFSFLRVSRPVMAISAFALLAGMVPCSFAKAGNAELTQAQPAAGQAGAGQEKKNWKDRDEYDLYMKITQTQDPKTRLQLLNTWQQKYPQTEFETERSQAFLATLGQVAQADPSQRQALIDKCKEILNKDPKNFTAGYYLVLIGPQLGGNNPSPDLISTVKSGAQVVLEQADTAFSAEKKPKGTDDASWAKAKSSVLGLAHLALGWAAAGSKDNATAENEYKASLQANPDQGTVAAAYAKLLIDEKKFPEGLFEYARAAEYTGPGPALPPATRTQLMDYFNKAYKDYHGSAEGADQLLSQAKTSALPPEGLNVTSQADLANKEAEKTNQRIASDPAFKIWYSIKQSLTDQGDQFFTNNVKEVEVPGGAEGVKNFTGTVISVDPPDKPTKVVLGVEDPTKPDATLLFSQPLPPAALEKIKTGQPIEFSGVVESYTKDPFMLTFKDPTIPGVQTAAPPKTGTKKGRIPPHR